VLTIHLFLK